MVLLRASLKRKPGPSLCSSLFFFSFLSSSALPPEWKMLLPIMRVKPICWKELNFEDTQEAAQVWPSLCFVIVVSAKERNQQRTVKTILSVTSRWEDVTYVKCPAPSMKKWKFLLTLPTSNGKWNWIPKFLFFIEEALANWKTSRRKCSWWWASLEATLYK